MTQQSEDGPLPLVEERLVVGKVARPVGHVRVATRTDHVEDVARAEVQRVAVEVTRVPVGRVVHSAPDTRVEGEVTIIPVIEERLVVQTELVLTEEIHVRRRATTEAVELPVTLRRQRAVVERTDPEDFPADPTPEGSAR